MEYQKISNLLGNTSDKVPRFITKEWIEVHDQSGKAENRYNPNKQIRFKTPMLRSDLCDKKLAFKNNTPFTSCISKINNSLIDNAEDLNVVMPMHILIEYSKNYRKTTGSLWSYYRDEPNSGFSGDNNDIKYSIKDSKSFDYKTSITEKL